MVIAVAIIVIIIVIVQFPCLEKCIFIYSFNPELGSRDTVVNKTDEVLVIMGIPSKGWETDNNQVNK